MYSVKQTFCMYGCHKWICVQQLYNKVNKITHTLHEHIKGISHNYLKDSKQIPKNCHQLLNVKA